MFVKVEPSGCCERKGMVQVRLCLFLDEGDYGYEKTLLTVPERELTKEELADKELAAKVPTKQVRVPFHNHFIYVAPTTTDKAILDIGEGFLKEAYGHWSEDRVPGLVNALVELPIRTTKRISDCVARVESLKSTELSRKVI